MKILIFVSKIFPYNNSFGESFINNEFPYLISTFDQVVFASIAAPKGVECQHSLPESSITMKLTDNQTKFKYLKYLVLSVKYLTDVELNTELKYCKNIPQQLAVCYYYARLMRAYSYFKNCFSNMNFKKNDQVTIYSFWFSDAAHLACLIKAYIQEKYGCDCKVVSRAHGYDLYENRNITQRIPFRKKCMARIDNIYPCSNDGVEYLKLLYPQYFEKIKAAYLGTNDLEIAPWRHIDKITIVTCSSISRTKRLDILVDAIEYLETHCNVSCIEWICIGNGNLLKDLKNAATLKIHQNIVTFMGEMNNDAIYDLYKSHNIDLLVNCSDSEGIPVSIMEAISLGIPIIARDVGGIKEIVDDKINGFLLDSDASAPEFAKALLKYMQMDATSINAMRMGARKKWKHNFDASKNYVDFSNEIMIRNNGMI